MLGNELNNKIENNEHTYYYDTMDCTVYADGKELTVATKMEKQNDILAVSCICFSNMDEDLNAKNINKLEIVFENTLYDKGDKLTFNYLVKFIDKDFVFDVNDSNPVVVVKYLYKIVAEI